MVRASLSVVHPWYHGSPLTVHSLCLSVDYWALAVSRKTVLYGH